MPLNQLALPELTEAMRTADDGKLMRTLLHTILHARAERHPDHPAQLSATTPEWPRFSKVPPRAPRARPEHDQELTDHQTHKEPRSPHSLTRGFLAFRLKLLLDNHREEQHGNELS